MVHGPWAIIGSQRLDVTPSLPQAPQVVLMELIFLKRTYINLETQYALPAAGYCGLLWPGEQ
jgi:hypothetical protein